jgi:hypothetical protein
VDLQEDEKKILISWKEIADYLDCGIRTCQRWEKEFKLPIHRFIDSSKSRVFAYKHEIDEWMSRENLSEKKSRRKYLYFLVPLVTLIFIYIMSLSLSPPSEPHDFRMDGSDLVILNKKGQEIWRYETGMRDLESEEFYRSHFQVRRCSGIPLKINLPLIMIRDINSDKKREVLFAPISVGFDFREYGLLCFSSRGKKKWSFDPGREMIFGEETYSSEYEISGFTINDLFNDGLSEVIVVSYNLSLFPTQLAVLDHRGQLIREYWNSGRIEDFCFYDLNKDGNKEIFLVGSNNEYNKGFLTVLKPDFISGSSPQTGYYRSPELEQGVEEHYILLPKISVGEGIYERGVIDQVKVIDDQIISILSRTGIYYEFDFSFALREIRFADRFGNLYNEIHQKNGDQDKFSPKVMADCKPRLLSEVLYYTGEDWGPSPLMAKNSRQK